MKLLHCTICKDILAEVPTLRICLCTRSQIAYDKELHKTVYSGPALILGIPDEEVIGLRNKLDKRGFFKSNYVVITKDASTIIKVKDVATYVPRKVKRRLDGVGAGGILPVSRTRSPVNIKEGI